MIKKIIYIPVTEEDREFFIKVHHTSYRKVIEEMFGWDEVLQDKYANKAFDEGGMQCLITKTILLMVSIPIPKAIRL